MAGSTFGKTWNFSDQWQTFGGEKGVEGMPIIFKKSKTLSLHFRPSVNKA